MKEAESSEQFFYGPVQSNKDKTEEDDDENFTDADETPKQEPVSQKKQTSPAPPPPTTNKVKNDRNRIFIYLLILYSNFSQPLNHRQLIN
jgi:hypothetical protein